MTEPAVWSEVRPKTLAGVLRARTAERPDQWAFTFLADGETESGRLTYAELDARATAIAAVLARSVPRGERALLLFPPGLDFIAAFFGCLYAGVVAVPAYPPRPNDRSQSRLRSIARDAEPRAALTTSAILAGVEGPKGLFAIAPELGGLRWIPADTPDLCTGGSGRELPHPDPESVAFLQYTSGSTSAPKGVMVTHANLVHNERMIGAAFEQDEDSVVVGWLPLYHDMGLIGNVLQPLHAGGRCVLMSPVAFLQKPLRWLSAVSRYRATTSGGPNFAYELCLRKIGPEEKAGLDLSSWRVAYNGAEPVRAETLERFAEAFAPCGFRRAAFYPCYGLAEATLFVTGGEPGRFPRVETVDAVALERHEVEPAPPESPRARLLVSCGRPSLGQRVAVVDAETGMEQPPGRVGEIWIAGESVARGYWKRDDATDRDFNAFLLGAWNGGEGPYLRTGDLGFLADGELFVTGRLKDLIIIRGRNHYPQDVELTAEQSHPDLRPGNGAAFSVEVGGEERLVLVHEVERRRREGLEEVAEAVRRAVAEEHEVQVHEVVLIRVGTLPKTSSGKVQRSLCRNLYLANELAVVGRSALAVTGPAAEAGLVLSRGALLALEPEERPGVLAAFLAERVAAAVGVPAGAVSPEQPLTSLGLDSLAAVELKGSVEAALGLPVPLSDLLQGIGTRALAEKILEAGPEMGEVPPVRALSLSGNQPLSFGQKGLWFLERLTPGGGAYNIAVAARAQGLDPAALGRALEAVVSRHDALRTVFQLVGEEPAQRVLPEARVDFAVEDASAWTERELEDRLAAEAWRPFSLETGPLVRLRVFERAEGERALLFAVHHLVADFWSLGIVARELGALYRQETGGPAAELPPVALRYTDFVEWQAERLAGERGERLWDFWRERLSGLPDLDLPTDRARPPVRTELGGARALALPPSLASEVRAFGASRGATLFMTLLAAFEAQLARTSGQEDFAVGSPTAGRPMPELAGLVGYLVNTVALRADLSGEPGFGRLVERVRAAALDGLEHGDFPFPLVAERLRPARDPARSPLFQAMLVLQRGRALDDPGLAAFALGEAGARIGLGGAKLESVRIAERRAQFDLTLRVTEDGAGGLGASLEYDASLWDGATADRMLGHFRSLLGAAMASPDTPVWHLPFLTAGERAQILEEWNETSRSYPRGLLLHERFEERAAERPRDEAVIAGDVRLTYEELNRRANQLAHHLRALGVQPEDRVGVCLRRSERMIAALLGILKAGGAYVPLDPAYPRERLDLILTDSGARLVVTEEGTAPDLAAFAEGRVQRVLLDADAIARESAWNPERAAGPGNLAYLIYTSGSTGRPKAVAIEHRSPVVLVHWAREVFPPTDLSDVLAATSIGFDLSVFEIFVPLSWGGRVVVAENALSLPALPAAGEVTLINTVPSAMAELVRAGQVPESVRVINLAGEPIPPALVEAIHALTPPRRLYNLYGPSEDTTYSTFALLASGSEAPIGRPLADTRVYLLDARGEPVPVGVPGELFLAGEGLARGYLGRPDLTAERFVPDPFATTPGARLYRTGDLARYRPDGGLDFLGRIDHQVKVRGFRVELGEIEAALARHPQVREVVVVAKDDGDRGKRLVAYVTPRGVAASELRQFLRESLPEHMVPSAFVRLEALPLSPNGKVDRKALPDPGLPGGDRAPAAPRSGPEDLLAGLVAEVLGVPRVGPHDDFFALGGHSLLATRLVARIARAFGVELPVSAVFVTPTVSGLAARIVEAGPALPAPPLVPVPRDGSPLPLSFAQKRLWLLDRIEPGNPAYNVPGAVRLAGPLGLAALERSLEGIVRRHEALRTVFRMDRGQPVQALQPAAARLPLVDLSDLPAFAREAEAERVSRRSAAQPFDLWRGPLYRMLALRLAPADHLLLVTFHHIVADGWSLAVFWNELAALYEGGTLPPLPVQYPDFAVWQRDWLRGEVFERQLAWWRERLAGLPVLELPTDHPRPAVRSFRGSTRTVFLPTSLAGALERLARREGVTPFMALLAAFQTLLARWTGASSIPVGSPVANRSRVETEGLIGFFVNTLVLRTEVGDDPAFAELLARVREVSLGAWAHQDLPFERLVEELRPERHLAQNPLFQVVFLLEEPLPAQALGSATARARRVENGTAKFDATLAVSPEDGGLAVSLEYDAALFDPQTVDRLLGHWRTLLEGIVADAGARLSDLPVLTAGEVEQVLGTFRGVAIPYPREAAIYELFEAEARRDPEAVALEIGDGRLTYGEIDHLANRLARRLRRAGVGLGAAVGLCVERSAALVVGMLGILKAGGAYVPLDPAYPEERLAFMAADAGMGVLVTQRELLGALPRVSEIVWIDASGVPDGSEESAAPLPPLAGGGDLAYVMYTSGSTGRPKGVEVPHRAVTRLVRGTGYVRFGRFEVFLQLAPASFDAATFEIWGALLNGARLALFPGRAGTLEEIAAAIARHRVTTLWLTAGLFHQMVESRLSGLAGVSQLLAGGDVLSPEAVRRALSGLPGTAVINGYGPTENTTFTACRPMRDPGEVETPVSIGTPIANTRVHLLDRSFQPVPVGVPGELFAGGDGVALGYRGRPDLTAERFVPDPFGERGGRLYRTGDLARWRPSGKIEFLGRADRQVKIRGFRIEPAEIEAALALHPEVGEAAVVVRDGLPGGRALVACAVPREGDELPGDLRDFLRERLPEYMLPSFFVALPALPLTANGKVDRAALALLGPEPGEGERELVLPRTPLEERLAGIWSEVLGVATVGVSDNFFELGGHSLLAVQVISRVSDALGVDLPLADLFEEPTVAGLASRLAGALATPQETRPSEPAVPPPVLKAAPRAVSAAPRTPLEAKLAAIWSEVLGVPDVGVNDDFFELGGHSLTAHQVSVRVAREIGVELPAQSLFEAPTVAALAERLAGLPATPLAPAPSATAPAGDGRPLSFAQHRLWLTDLLEPGSTAYNLSVAARLAGSLAPLPIARSLAEVLRRHEPLRTVFPQAGGEPVQVVLPPPSAAALPLARVDLAGVAPEQRAEALRAVLRAEAERPFDLARGPVARFLLVRLASREHVLVVSFHHIAADGWSMGVFFEELAALYGAFLAGLPSPLPELPLSYADFALWQRREAEGEAVLAQLAWWRRELAGLSVLELPTDRPRAAARSHRGANRPFAPSAELAARLRALAPAEGITLFVALLGGFAAVLSRWSGQGDVPVGVPSAGRSRVETEGMIGFFVNTLVLRGRMEDDPPFVELLRRLRRTAVAAQANQGVPFDRLVEELHPHRDPGVSPLFQVMFAFLAVPPLAVRMPGLEASLLDVETRTAKFDLTLSLNERNGALAGFLEYRTELFEDATADRFLRHLTVLLEGAAADPGLRLSELPLLSEAERGQLLAWGGTPAPAGDLRLHRLFEERARISPDAPALVFEGEASAVPFRELDLRADRLAQELRALGIAPEARVAVCLERSPGLVAAMLAVWKAGGVYVPVDPAYPRERIELLLAESGAAALVSRDGVSLVASRPGGSPGFEADPRNLAYVIYTSGSTGRPKGVAVEHGQAATHCDTVRQVYGLTPADRVLSFASPGFDVSIEQILPSLAAGAAVVLRGSELWEPGDLARKLEELGVTVANLPTVYWHRFASESRDSDPPSSLRLVIAGGEAMTAGAARLWAETPLSRVRLLNAYGPTEAIVTATVWEAGGGIPGTTAPIGRPIPGRSAHVVDRHGGLAPVGVTGELLLGGLLARGYLGSPEATASQFVPDPFSGVPGARLYRTGDLVRRLPGGDLEFAGRIDGQVKVRGFRIETVEVEAALAGHPAVREAVVMAVGEGDGRRLAAWVVPEAGAALSAAGLQAFLTERLPAFLVPSSFTLLPALPLTPHGKVDRRALPSPEAPAPGSGAAGTPAEELLAGLWSDLLGAACVGPNDDFFALGGHSLLATQAISRVRRLFGVDLPVSALFEAPTPAALAGRIAAARGAGGPVAPPIVPMPRGPEGAPLSFAQQRLWFLDRLEPGSVAYNVPGALRLTGALRPDVLGRALAEIVRRHEALRTVFREGPREPLQIVLPPADRPLPVVDLAGLPEEERESEAGRLLAREARSPFDLAAGPLIRAALLRLGEEEHRLAIVLHHVISDAWSMEVMLRELGALYRAFAAGLPSPLPELPVQYADFAVWQRRWLADEVLRREVEHWKGRLAGAPEALLLPLDRPRPAVPSRPGGRVPFALPPDLAADLKALGRREGWTAFMILLAAFEALLARLSGQRDVVVGSPIANRNRLETEGLIGFFTNTLALRLDLAGDPAFRTLAHRARAVTLDAHAHQDLPFEKLVEELHPGRDLARTPVFQVMLVVQSLPSFDPGLPGIEAELLDVRSGEAKLDLMLSLTEDGEGRLAGDLEYDRELFEEATASRLASRFAALLAEAVRDPEQTLSSLPLLSAAERDEITAWGEGRVFVLGPDLDLLPAGVTGELYVAGDRTGDLARWRPGGEIEILDPSLLRTEGRGASAPEGREEIVAPRTPVEELLVRIFREVLEIPRVGVTQSFFELGGHSLLAARLVFRVREVFGVEIPLRRVFERPLLEDLAAEIEAAVESGSSTLAPPLRPVPHDGPLPLSFAQERLWFLNRLEEGGALYNIPLAVRLRGELPVSALAAAFQEIVRRHEALRTVFPERDGDPVQVIGPPPAAWKLPVVDVSALPAAVREAEARSLGEREALTVFPLDRGPLLSNTLLHLGEGEHLLILNMHHIVSDGWSLGVLLAELGALYGAARAGAPSPLPELPVQYVDFAVWQRRWLSGDRLAAQVEFWRRQLAGVPAVFELPSDRPRPAVQTQNGARVPLRLPRDLSSRLAALARGRGITPFMLLLAAWQALLHRATGQEDFNVGSPVAGRNRRETERLIGFFVNTLVLRADLSGNPAFEELLLRTRRVALAAYSHQDLPFEKLVDELKPARDLAHQPLVQVMFSLQNTPLGALEMPGLTLTPLELGETLAKFDVTLVLSEAPGGIAGTVEYNTDLFDRSTIARLAAHLGVLLESIADDPARRISDLHLLTDGERHQLLLEWADAGRSFHGVSLHQLFERQVALRPGTQAAVFEDVTWSYAELDRRANQLAHYLLRLGVGPEVRVGLFVERSLDMLAGMFGVLKTGGAYVPLDPGYPRERLAFTLDDSAARVVLTQERLVNRLPETGARVVRLDADWEEIALEPGESPGVPVAADDLAYVIYTSGSTGKPKGVMIPHRAAVLYVSTTSPFFGIGPGGRNMQFSSISFDASVEEMYGCLTHGATLYVRGEVQEGISELLAWMTERRITWAQLPTAFWHQLTAAMETEDLPFPPALRVLMIGGEKALAQRLVAWWKRVPEGFRFINAYGPTETTVAATLAAFPGARPVGESLLELPLGRPLSYVRAYVLDRRLRPVPIGVTGELHLGGQSLARGYLGRPDLTAEKFIPNPLAYLADKTGERLYRTGDLVRLLPDGMLEFVGRVDDQVKIRGFRIELGEIETTLARHPNVGEAVVMTREDAPGEKHLVAYVSPRTEPAPTPEELAAFLARQLPAYMVPGALLVLPSMPTNAHGKVDRRALAGIAPGPPRSRQETYVAPQSELEERIAAVWREIFGLEQVGVHDNFFDLGGNSLLIVKLHSRLQKSLGRDFPLVDLFKHPTVAALAQSLGAVRTEKPSLDRARARTETRRESMKQLQEMRDRRRKAEKGTARKP